MRTLGIIPHPRFRIEVYSLDKHFYVEVEAGPMKQCYKFHKEQAESLEGVKKIMDAAFLEKSYALFEEMYKNQQAALTRFADAP